MEPLVKANIHFLDQAERLLIKVLDQDYGCAVESFYGSSLGQHMRHCLDHYRTFLVGLSQGKIDYDHRARSREVEVSTECALTEVCEIRNQLVGLLSSETPVGVMVKMDCGWSGDDDWQLSTLGRELQFLVSHTVHHFAMISGMCGFLGVEMERGFGMAPSTLKHLETASMD